MTHLLNSDLTVLIGNRLLFLSFLQRGRERERETPKCYVSSAMMNYNFALPCY